MLSTTSVDFGQARRNLATINVVWACVIMMDAVPIPSVTKPSFILTHKRYLCAAR